LQDPKTRPAASSRDKGNTAQPIKLKIKVSIGAIKNIIMLELLGKIASSTNNFNPSAKGCNIEQQSIDEDKAFRVNLWLLLGTL
jgi:hypothetical protein